MCARQPSFIYFTQKEGIVLNTFLLEIYISKRKRKVHHLHFEALQVSILAEVISNHIAKRPDLNVSNKDVKPSLIRIILTELFCIYTRFTKIEAGLGFLPNLYILCPFPLLFATISHLLC